MQKFCKGEGGGGGVELGVFKKEGANLEYLKRGAAASSVRGSTGEKLVW